MEYIVGLVCCTDDNINTHNVYALYTNYVQH